MVPCSVAEEIPESRDRERLGRMVLLAAQSRSVLKATVRLNGVVGHGSGEGKTPSTLAASGRAFFVASARSMGVSDSVHDLQC